LHKDPGPNHPGDYKDYQRWVDIILKKDKPVNEENEEAFATELNQEAIETVVDRIADQFEDGVELPHLGSVSDQAMELGIPLSDLMKRVSVELLARGS
jgi:hypothetical protein